MAEPMPTAEEAQIAREVLEKIRDYHDETGLVGEVNTLNEAHSLISEFEDDHNL